MAKRTKRLTSQEDEKDEIRINKFLSEAGVCSRREADRYILDGKVEIDGIVAETGSKVTKDSKVTFCGNPVKREEKLVLIAFNKPEGIVCTTDQSEPDNIIDFINYGMRIYPIGRLDKDSQGLILLTNDGNIVNKILRAENKHEKEYIVTVNKEINQEFIKNMSSGVPILNTVTNPCTVKQIDKTSFNIILTQGLNRQIRRMCEHLGYRVISLTRVRIMNIQLGRLKTGDFRNVTEKEIEELNEGFQEQKGQRETKSKSNQQEKVKKKEENNKEKSNNDISGKNRSSKDKSSKDKGSKDKNSKDKNSKDKSSKDKGSKDKGNTDKYSKDKNSKDKNSKDKNREDKYDKKITSSKNSNSSKTQSGKLHVSKSQDNNPQNSKRQTLNHQSYDTSSSDLQSTKTQSDKSRSNNSRSSQSQAGTVQTKDFRRNRINSKITNNHYSKNK